MLNNRVYDVTKYLEYHPGGKDKLMLAAGRDGTSLFSKQQYLKQPSVF